MFTEGRTTQNNSKNTELLTEVYQSELLVDVIFVSTVQFTG